jgi:hypothetical protein
MWKSILIYVLKEAVKDILSAELPKLQDKLPK